MTAYLAIPDIPIQAAAFICLGIFSAFVALGCWLDGNKGRRVYDDHAAANTRADLESDEFRTSADEAMAQGNDHGRVRDRRSA